MTMRLLVAVIVSALALSPVTNAEESAAKSALTRLSNLAGEWEGSYQWTGARTDSGKLSARYYMSGNGTVVVEDLISNGKPSMTSVYHLDGNDLRATHYCGAGNQPRLKARQIDLEKGFLDFDYVDSTNLKSPDAPHVNGIEIEMLDKDHLLLTFRFIAGSKESREKITLSRTAES